MSTNQSEKQMKDSVNLMDDENKVNDKNKETGEKKQIKLILKKINLVATWKYGIDTQNCEICGKDLMMPVYEQETKGSKGTKGTKGTKHQKNTLSADVTIGTCDHGFHKHCIDNWISEGNLSCPYCQTMWKGSKNVGSSVYVYKSN